MVSGFPESRKELSAVSRYVDVPIFVHAREWTAKLGVSPVMMMNAVVATESAMVGSNMPPNLHGPGITE